jgi:hypothetical protein
VILGSLIEAALQTDSICPVREIADDELRRFPKLQRLLPYGWCGALISGNAALESPKGRQPISAGGFAGTASFEACLPQTSQTQ